MVHHIRTDGVVAVRGKGDLKFRPDAIHARDQDRLAHSRKIRREQPAEATDLPQHLGAMRPFDSGLDAFLDQVAQIDIDARAGVSFLCLCHI